MWWIVWVGCSGVDEESFPDRYVDAWCARALECVDSTTVTGQVRYGSEEECAASLSGTVPPAEGCTFDADAAAECLDQLGDLPCLTYASAPACALVYSGCTAGGHTGR